MTQLYQPQSVFRHVCLVSCPQAQPVPSSLSLRGSPPSAFFLWKASPPSLLLRWEATSSVFLNKQSLTDVLQNYCLLLCGILTGISAPWGLWPWNIWVWKTGKKWLPWNDSFSCILPAWESISVCWLLPLFLSIIIVRRAHVYGMPTISTCGIPGKALPVHYLFNFLSKQGINTIPI